ncbi:MAG: elongation factor Ts [Candidatus Yonathbacteria bacterium]|nr:elongation factor Ts [Candidatus Yonathbacteria bacterium]
MITTEDIKALREKTGVSVMQCKKALEEAGGDMDKALVLLHKLSSAIAAKKADRELGAGIVEAYKHNSGTVGAMVELLCETDFVAKNTEFRALAYDIAMHIAATAPAYLSMNDVTLEERTKAEDAFKKEVDESDKPADIKAKMLEGKVAGYLKERVLLEQPFIKNPDITIGGLVDQAVQKFGEKTQIGRFARFSIE